VFRGDSCSVSHPIFTGTASVSMFRVSPLPPLRNTEGRSLYRCYRHILAKGGDGPQSRWAWRIYVQYIAGSALRVDLG
jgi:hypothetical protein